MRFVQKNRICHPGNIFWQIVVALLQVKILSAKKYYPGSVLADSVVA